MTANQDIVIDAFFLDTPSGRRFASLTRPTGRSRGTWLFVQPFAEEMNKCRRMTALGAQALSRKGWSALIIDLAGCGDSAGEFGDASWQAWLDDLSYGWQWLRREFDCEVGIWALRAGCLLAADWLAQSGASPPLLLWQPVRNGQQHLAQFLRLKAASEMLSGGGTSSVAQLRQMLDEGQAIEVAGYRLSPSLAQGLGTSRLSLPDGYRSPAEIFEIVSDDNSDPSPGVSSLAASWRDAGVPVNVSAVGGARFWQTVEIETAPALIDATVHAVGKLSP